MSSELDDRIDELLALAALGEISPAEEAELDAALAADASLAAELDADLAVAASLQATLATDPPASLRASVMSAIDELERTEPQGSEAPEAREARGVADVADFAAERAKRRSRGWQSLSAAAAVVLLLVGGIFAFNRGDDGPSFDAIAAAEDGQHRLLDGQLAGTLDVVYSPSQGAFALVGNDVPTLTDDETYQLWFVDDAGPRSVGLFRPDDDGTVEEVFADLDPSGVVVGVTIEPAAGSESPTLPIVAAA